MNPKNWLKFGEYVRLVMLCAMLAACGGGGGGGNGGGDSGGNLVVAFSYPQTATTSLLETLNVQPTISGLNGNSPNCSLNSGNLPPGVTVNSNCSITGSPQAAGEYSIIVQMTVSGYSQYITAATVINVETPQLVPIQASSGPELNFTAFAQVNNVPIAQIENYTPQAGDVLQYQILPDAPLPAGLTLNASTGTVSGVPTVAEPGRIDVVVAIIRNGYAYQTMNEYITYNVAPDSFSFNYPQNYYTVTVGEPVNVAPVLTNFPSTVTSYSFSVGSPLPPGVTFNTATGVFSGAPTTVGQYPNTVSLHIGGTSQVIITSIYFDVPN